MNSKNLILLFAIVALSIVWLCPSSLIASEKYANNATGNGYGQLDNEATSQINGQKGSTGGHVDPIFLSSNGKLNIILLPDWRGGDRIMAPILIRFIQRPKHSDYRVLAR
jgi:hypothetical protein